jgi:hypothetical protein
MKDDTFKTSVCRNCGATRDATDNYCRRCGMPTPNQQATRPLGWSESPWFILPLLFLIIGPLALPLLWRSRYFTPLGKLILTVLVAILTVYLCWSVWVVVNQAIEPLNELERIRR